MPRAPRVRSCALAIGGLDPGGGAGILADVRAMTAAGAFGCAIVAVSTVQSTDGMRASRPMPARWISAQAAEVLDHQRVRAVKLGALGDAANVRAVARILALRPDLPLVLDVPLRATRGRGSLLARDAVATLRRELLPRANLVTVNTLEAEALTGVPVASAADARGAARALVAAGAQAALVKGGHLEGARATDVLAVGQQVLELHARRLPGPGAHGTGCTLASLVAGRLALRDGAGLSAATLVEAVRWAKRAHHAALSRATAVGGAQDVLVF